MQYWTPKHFASSLDDLAKQVLPPHIYNIRGMKGLYLMDPHLLKDIDTLRGDLGIPLVVNNGSNRTQSGYRTKEFYTSERAYFESMSDHKGGKALDFISPLATAQEIRVHILTHSYRYPSISFLETGELPTGDPMSWVHMSSRMRIKDTSIVCWSPVRGFVSHSTVIAEGL